MLCADVGGTAVKAALISVGRVRLPQSYKIKTFRSVPTRSADGFGGVRDSIVKALNAVRSEDLADVVAIATAGEVMWNDGSVLHATKSLPGFEGYAFAKDMSERLGKRVVVINDACAAAVCEHYFTRRRVASTLVLTIGTGLGSALVTDGPIDGEHVKDLELGHMIYRENGIECGCGKRDCEWCGRIWKLMDAVDSYVPTPERATDKPFLMPIEDVFTITGRGTVVTGRIERGTVKVGDEAQIVGLTTEIKKTVITGIEMFRKQLDMGMAGDNAGCLLRGIDKTEGERGQVLAKPNSITPHTKFAAQVYVLSKEEGGRHTPFFNNYRPQFYFRTTDVTGTVQLEEGVEMVMPGDNTVMHVTLITPIAMEVGLRFAIREGGKTVGAGAVTEIIE